MNSVLVTIPVCNEAAMLDASLHRLVRDLDASGISYRLSVAEDGSSDATPAVLQRLQAEFPSLLVSTSPHRRGRGWALRHMWSEIDADIYAFVDADLAAGPTALIDVVSAVQRGADVATGSRYCAGAIVRRPPLRDLVSRGYNWIVRRTFGDHIEDHQCGLKAFTRESMADLLTMSRENSWAWDTEVLVLAELAGMRVAEVPVEWTEYRVARTPIRRLLSDIYLHGASLLRLKSGLHERLGSKRRGTSTHSPAPNVASVGSQGNGSGFLR
jgi:glycosyltransferase involved in cell wall biosynthesis